MRFLVGQRNMAPESEIAAAFEGIFERGYFANNGPMVRKLDVDLADYLHVAFGVSVASELVGMMLLSSAAFGTGEVVAPASIGAGMLKALQCAGVDVVYADVDPTTFALDPASLRGAVTKKTLGIVAVHTFGRVAGAADSERVARELGLPLIFDGSDALGSRADGRGPGEFGAGALLSLHERCVLNAAQGGFIATNSELIARHIRTTRNFHQGETFVDGLLRLNGKMAESCAALALVGLNHLEAWILNNQRRASIYLRTMHVL